MNSYEKQLEEENEHLRKQVNILLEDRKQVRIGLKKLGDHIYGRTSSEGPHIE
jgi:hypothetical protein